LPARVLFPKSFAVSREARESELKLSDAVSQAFYAPSFIAGLECGGDHDAPARRHLRNISSDHHEGVARIAEGRDQRCEGVNPLRQQLAVIAVGFDLLEDAGDKDLLFHFEFGVLGVRCLPRIAELLPGTAGQRKALLVLLVPLPQWDIQPKTPAGKAFSGV
jgi:hypothetical protein